MGSRGGGARPSPPRRPSSRACCGGPWAARLREQPVDQPPGHGWPMELRVVELHHIEVLDGLAAARPAPAARRAAVTADRAPPGSAHPGPSVSGEHLRGDAQPPQPGTSSSMCTASPPAVGRAIQLIWAIFMFNSGLSPASCGLGGLTGTPAAVRRPASPAASAWTGYRYSTSRSSPRRAWAMGLNLTPTPYGAGNWSR